MNFTPPSGTSALGVNPLTVTINTNKVIQESSYTNNTSTINVDVMRLCKVEDKGRTIPFHAQTDNPWGSDPFGITTLSKKSGTMSQYGCSVTAFEMLMESYGIKNTPLGSPANPAIAGISTIPGLQGEPLNPGTLNFAFANYRTKFLPNNGSSVALNSQNDPLWAGFAEVARAGYQAQCANTANLCDPNNAPNVISYKDYKPMNQQLVEDEICNGNPVILKFKKAGGGQHFMLATGVSLDSNGNKTFRLNNPGFSKLGKGQLQSDLVGKYPSILGYVLFHPSADPSMIFITAPVNVHLVVTDPLGRRFGYDPTTGTTYSEIPGAYYGEQSINTPNEDGFTPETLVDERYFSNSSDVLDGSYQVQTFAVASGSYYLDYRSYDAAGFTNDASLKTGTLQAGKSAVTYIQHLAESVPNPNASIKLREYTVHKLHRNSYSQSDIRLNGEVIPNVKSVIALKKNFSVLIGGISGYSLSVPATQFKEIKESGKALYVFNHHNTEIRLFDSGKFEIELEKVDLSSVDPTQFGYVRLDIDSISADASVSFKCRDEICGIDKDRDHDDGDKHKNDHDRGDD